MSITDTLSKAISKCKCSRLVILISAHDFNQANEALFGFPYTAIPFPLDIGLHYEFTIDIYATTLSL